MKSSDQRFLEHWSEVRKEGRWMYAMKRGVLFFALPVYVGTEFIKYLFRGTSYVFSWDRVLTGLIIWTSLGFLSFAFFLWQMQEKRYLELQKKESP
ncbi:MAG: hypothetical protein ABL895_22080 [Cyclobacteriaceae bacterium]